MVMRHSPEPPKECGEDFSPEGAVAEVMESSEEDELAGNAVTTGAFQYELLPQEPPLAANGDELDTGGVLSLDVGSCQMNEAFSDSPAPDDLTESSFLEHTSELSRPELVIDAEEVRAAMRNVTLPPEAFPPWADLVPESQLTEYVLMRAGNRRQDLTQQPTSDSPQR